MRNGWICKGICIQLPKRNVLGTVSRNPDWSVPVEINEQVKDKNTLWPRQRRAVGEPSRYQESSL